MSWEVIVSPILDFFRYLARSRISFEIDGLMLHPEWCGDIKGYKGIVRVTNKGKRIAYNLTARIESERDGLYDEVLEVELWEDKLDENRKEKTLIHKKEPAYDIDYEWMDEKKRITRDVWEQLRKDDIVFLQFPKQPENDDSASHLFPRFKISKTNVLKLMAGVEHKITITVKAENSDKNTVTAKRTFAFKVEHEDDAFSICIA